MDLKVLQDLYKATSSPHFFGERRTTQRNFCDESWVFAKQNFRRIFTHWRCFQEVNTMSVFDALMPWIFFPTSATQIEDIFAILYTQKVYYEAVGESEMAALHHAWFRGRIFSHPVDRFSLNSWHWIHYDFRCLWIFIH